jgi:hypothetical protein
MAANVVTASAIAEDAIGASELAADAVAEIQSGLASSAALTTAQADLDDIQTRLPAALVSGRIDASVGEMSAGSIQSIWDALTSALITAGSIGKYIVDGLASIAGYIDTEVAAIKAKTDNLPASPAATGDAMTLTSGERTAIATAHLDLADGVEASAGSAPSFTVRSTLRQILAFAVGKHSGMATATPGLVQNPGATKDRFKANGDADGNRTPVSWDNS